MEGPRTIGSNATTRTTWAEAFCTAIGKRHAGRDRAVGRVQQEQSRPRSKPASRDRRQAASGQSQARVQCVRPPRIPKPPRPGSAPKPDTAVETIPDPKTNIRAFLGWLDTKLAAFPGAEGDKANDFWNDTVQPRIDDLDGPTQEDCMGIWSKHEIRWN
jgi:hypothetical protein